MKIPVDLSALNVSNLVPDGRHRARVSSIGLYPKDVELGENGEIPGKTWDDGSPQYAWLRVGFMLTEHDTNYGVDGKGRPVSLAGKFVWQNYRLNQLRKLQELFNNAGVQIPTEGELDGSLLIGKEVDVYVQTMARKDDPEQKENRITAVRVALDKTE